MRSGIKGRPYRDQEIIKEMNDRHKKGDVLLKNIKDNLDELEELLEELKEKIDSTIIDDKKQLDEEK